MMNINPKQMQAMMKQMGIKQEEIDASKVTIEKNDGGKIIINDPSIQKINMQGNVSFQISGDISEVTAELFSQDDVKTVMEKTGVSKDDAIKALENSSGDLAEAIMELSE